MSPTNNAKVIIGGNVYTLSGEESEEYIQRVANYINNKLLELKQSDNARQLNTRLMSVLLEINMADDYFKAKEAAESLHKEINGLEKTIASLKTQLEKADEDKQRALNDLMTCKKELNEYIEMFEQEDKNY